MTSNKKVLKVLKGFAELTSEEKRIFREELIRHNNSYDKDTIEKGWRSGVRLDVGPTNTDSCPCCGR